MNRSTFLRIIEETGHHPIGASAATRWMQCPGSVELTYNLPDQSSPAAVEGTAAHTLAEICLAEDCDTKDVEGYPDDMREHIQGYVDYVRNLRTPGSHMAIEYRLDLSSMIPEGMGTADVVMLSGHTLHIIDLKYGLSPVSAENNKQLQIYAVGALDQLKKKGVEPKYVDLHIYQPRAGGAKVWETDPLSLAIYAETVRIAVDLCLGDDAPLNPEEKACEYCKAKATCPALYNKSLEVVGGDFEVLPAVNSMTDDQLRLVLGHKTLIEKWLKAVEASVSARLEHGERFDGYKMVEGRSVRKWADNAEEVLSKLLGDAAYDRKMIGITQAEKVLGKKHLSELGITEKPPGKPTLVPDTDKRIAIGVIADDFSEL